MKLSSFILQDFTIDKEINSKIYFDNHEKTKNDKFHFCDISKLYVGKTNFELVLAPTQENKVEFSGSKLKTWSRFEQEGDGKVINDPGMQLF